MSEPYSERRVVLASGEEVEVVAYGTGAEVPPLERCPRCDSDHVQPVDWSEAGLEHWQLELRCPNCGWEAVGIYPHDAVESFEDHLDRATEELVTGLRRLAHARMAEDVERFVAALAGDHVLPEDF